MSKRYPLILCTPTEFEIIRIPKHWLDHQGGKAPFVTKSTRGGLPTGTSRAAIAHVPGVAFKPRKKSASIWVVTGLLGIVLCIIAVGGSSAMIRLRHSSSVFDVRWIGE